MPCPGPSAKDATHGLARRLHQAPTGEKSTPNLCTSLAVAGCPVYRRRCPAGWGMAEGKCGWRLQKGKDEGGDRCPFGSGGWLCHSELLWPVGLTLVLRDARATWGELVKESERGCRPKDCKDDWSARALGPWVRRLHGPRCPKRPWVAFVRRRVRVPPRPGSSDFQKRFWAQLYSPLQATKRCFRRFSTQNEGRGSRPFYQGGMVKGSVKKL